MITRTSLSVASMLLAFSGCDLLSSRTPKPVPVADVINKVKDEIRVFYESPIDLTKAAAPAAVCNSEQGTHTVKLRPDSIKLTLKTVATRANDPSVGLKAQLAVLSVDPSYSGSYSKSNAQSMEFNLGMKVVTPTSKSLSRELALTPPRRSAWPTPG